MRITLASIFVEDQDRALAFYTNALGFEKKHDIPLGAISLAHGDLRRRSCGRRTAPGTAGVSASSRLSEGSIRRGNSSNRFHERQHP